MLEVGDEFVMSAMSWPPKRFAFPHAHIGITTLPSWHSCSIFSGDSHRPKVEKVQIFKSWDLRAYMLASHLFRIYMLPLERMAINNLNINPKNETSSTASQNVHDFGFQHVSAVVFRDFRGYCQVQWFFEWSDICSARLSGGRLGCASIV